MPYDPFAPVPVAAPAPIPAPAPIAAPVATPPAPLDPGNALAPVVVPPPALAAPGAGLGVDLGVTGDHPMSFVGPNGHIADMQGFMQALQTWRGTRPDQFNFDPNSTENRVQQRGDWRSTMQDWRGTRPTYRDYRNGGTMTPGGGTTGAPLPGTPAPLPPTSIGMVPGVPGSMGTNPNGNTGIVPPNLLNPIMTPGGGGTGAPVQGGMPNFASWRSPTKRGF